MLPTLNEEAGIEEYIRRAQEGLDALGLSGKIIVSESSADRTSEIARALNGRVVKCDSPEYG